MLGFLRYLPAVGITKQRARPGVCVRRGGGICLCIFRVVGPWVVPVYGGGVLLSFTVEGFRLERVVGLLHRWRGFRWRAWLGM